MSPSTSATCSALRSSNSRLELLVVARTTPRRSAGLHRGVVGRRPGRELRQLGGALRPARSTFRRPDRAPLECPDRDRRDDRAPRRRRRPPSPGTPARRRTSASPHVDPHARSGSTLPLSPQLSVIVTDSMTTGPEAVLAARRHRLERLEHVETVDQLAEQRVLRWQTHAGRAGHDEELAAVGVRSGIRHRQRADLVLAGLGQLVLEAIAGAAPAGPLGAAALDHEALDDPVEDEAVVVVVRGPGSRSC